MVLHSQKNTGPAQRDVIPVPRLSYWAIPADAEKQMIKD